MRIEISLVIIALIIIAAVVIQTRFYKTKKRLLAQEEFINAQAKLLQEADALVSDETISEDELYEKSQIIFKKLEELKSTKTKV